MNKQYLKIGSGFLKVLMPFFIFSLLSLTGYCQSDQVKAAIQMLKDKDAQVRTEAAQYLGIAKDTRAVEPLKGALKDAVPSVRATAVTSLAEIEGQRAVFYLIPAWEAEKDKEAKKL